MSRIIKFILFLAFFLVFFEAGLIASYTIVTSEAPDVEKLIDMQIDRISALLAIGEGVNDVLIGSPESLNVTNMDLVAESLKNKSKLNGVDVQSINVTTYGDTSEEVISLNITAKGYKETQSGGNKSGGQIVITPTENYIITASASGKSKNNGVEIDVNTIKIVSVGRLYTNSTRYT
ncbi:hypothetical protein [Methanobacterium alcaliphilum]|uniref:hypothetical protein n=1 Tax=Methanobacterium alcaliphilum TaxID=392018 RepID=UPI00200B70B6|nr:hypothetical protein [Methanobacterium alcaliphilum]MCK9151123.1 hypothetical protein [Methanobacterium alcaliphilum]